MTCHHCPPNKVQDRPHWISIHDRTHERASIKIYLCNVCGNVYHPKLELNDEPESVTKLETNTRTIKAHNTAGLRLKNFFGAGSSASAMLDKMGLKDNRITEEKYRELLSVRLSQLSWSIKHEPHSLSQIAGSLMHSAINTIQFRGNTKELAMRSFSDTWGRGCRSPR